jgi:hypothetical protein
MSSKDSKNNKIKQIQSISKNIVHHCPISTSSDTSIHLSNDKNILLSKIRHLHRNLVPQIRGINRLSIKAKLENILSVDGIKFNKNLYLGDLFMMTVFILLLIDI